MYFNLNTNVPAANTSINLRKNAANKNMMRCKSVKYLFLKELGQPAPVADTMCHCRVAFTDWFC
jgi:hypothetical protein